MAKKPLDDDDLSLWKRVAASVTPMLRRRAASVEAPPPSLAKAPDGPAKKTGAMKTSPPAAAPSMPLVSSPLQPANLDDTGFGGISRSSARSIKTGRAGFTARIDLHGLSRDQAQLRLTGFLTEKAHAGHRHVLVITGKGVRGGGVIRRQFPEWISSPPLNELVIAYCQAQPKDGGDGAWYVNLRRP